jgi:hypothetical protein
MLELCKEGISTLLQSAEVNTDELKLAITSVLENEDDLDEKSAEILTSARMLLLARAKELSQAEMTIQNSIIHLGSRSTDTIERDIEQLVLLSTMLGEEEGMETLLSLFLMGPTETNTNNDNHLAAA